MSHKKFILNQVKVLQKKLFKKSLNLENTVRLKNIKKKKN